MVGWSKCGHLRRISLHRRNLVDFEERRPIIRESQRPVKEGAIAVQPSQNDGVTSKPREKWQTEVGRFVRKSKTENGGTVLEKR